MRENRLGNVTVTIEGIVNQERTLEVSWREKKRKRRWL